LKINPEDGGDMFLRNVADFHWAIWRYIPEERTLHNHHYENLKFDFYRITRRYTSEDNYVVLQVGRLDARLTTFFGKKKYCCEIQRTENWIKSGRII
jgi:hypothetical protein